MAILCLQTTAVLMAIIITGKMVNQKILQSLIKNIVRVLIS